MEGEASAGRVHLRLARFGAAARRRRALRRRRLAGDLAVGRCDRSAAAVLGADEAEPEAGAEAEAGVANDWAAVGWLPCARSTMARRVAMRLTNMELRRRAADPAQAVRRAR